MRPPPAASSANSPRRARPAILILAAALALAPPAVAGSPPVPPWPVGPTVEIPPPPLPDPTAAPRIVAVSPADGATSVPIDAEIELSFSEPVDFWAAAWPRTLDSGRMLDSEAILLTSEGDGGERVRASFVMTMPRSGVLVLAPVRWGAPDWDTLRRLEPATEYTVSVTPRVVDLQGTPVEATTWSFTTAPEAAPPDPGPDEPITRVETTVTTTTTTQAEPCPLPPPAAPPADGPVRLDLRSLATTQQIASAALRRAAAIERWLDRAPCAPAAGLAAASESAPLARRGRSASAAPTRRHLLIDRRIATAALRRIAALEARLAGTAAAPAAPAARRADLALTAAQARINRRVARAALRRAEALAARLTAG